MVTKEQGTKVYLKMPRKDLDIGIAVLSGNGYKFLTYMHTRMPRDMFDPVEIARLLGITKRTLGTVFGELQEKGFMHIEHNKTHELCILGLDAVFEYKRDLGITE